MTSFFNRISVYLFYKIVQPLVEMHFGEDMADHVTFARILVNQSDNGFNQLAILLSRKVTPHVAEDFPVSCILSFANLRSVKPFIVRAKISRLHDEV